MKASIYFCCAATVALALLPPSVQAQPSRETLGQKPVQPPNDLLIEPPKNSDSDAANENTDANIAVLTARAVQEFQFSQHPFDAEISGRFLDRYLETLDYYHGFFLQSDLKEFEAYRTNLQIYTLAKHDITPAYVIFGRFLERATEREAYETNLLQSENFTFTDHDRFTPDRHELPNPQDMKEATNLWREEVRLDYLNEKLAQKLYYFGPVTFDAQKNLVVTLQRLTNATSFAFLPRTFQDQQGHEFGRADVSGNDATNATIHLQIPSGGDLLKITNHFFTTDGTDLGLVRFERSTDTNNAAAPGGAAVKEYVSRIELKDE